MREDWGAWTVIIEVFETSAYNSIRYLTTQDSRRAAADWIALNWLYCKKQAAK